MKYKEIKLDDGFTNAEFLALIHEFVEHSRGQMTWEGEEPLRIIYSQRAAYPNMLRRFESPERKRENEYTLIAVPQIPLLSFETPINEAMFLSKKHHVINNVLQKWIGNVELFMEQLKEELETHAESEDDEWLSSGLTGQFDPEAFLAYKERQNASF